MLRTFGPRQDFEAHDERFNFRAFSNALVERPHSGMLWAEGPVCFGDGGCVLFSDIPRTALHRWVDGHAGVFRQPSYYTSGNTGNRQGRLISCQHGTRSVTRTEQVSNLCFGGPRRNRLFITATRSFYNVHFAVKGTRKP